MTKCVIKNCPNPVEDVARFRACNQYHGYAWNQIKYAIENGLKEYRPSTQGFSKALTEEDINYYKQQL